jgi:hypothetical protein
MKKQKIQKATVLFLLFISFSSLIAGQSNETELLYEMPEFGNDTSVPEHLLGYPNQVSGGFYGPQILGMVFGGVFLTFMAGRTGPKVSVLASGFATWVTSLLLYGVTLISNLNLITEYQVIVTSTLLFVGLMVTYAGGR